MRWHTWRFTVVLLLTFTTHVALADAPGDSDSKRASVSAAIRAGLEQHDVPGASIALIDDYQVIWSEGYGVLREGGEQRVSPDTRFQAASISKPIAALAALRLVEQGKLDLDAPVNEQLKSWQIPETPITKKAPIKLKHLLSHFAGLNVHGFPGYATSDKCPTLLEVLDGQPPANTVAVRATMRPGYAFRYSGGGYCIVQQLLIDTTGESFPRLMQQLVLEPLGMTHSTYEQPLPQSWAAEAAVAHRAQRAPVTGNWHVYPEMAAAGLWTTPSDLALAAIDVAKSYAGKDGKLLTHQMARQMLTPQNPKFGLGFVVSGEGPALTCSHGGGNEGYRCQLIAYPATGQGLAIMTNSDTGSAMFRDVIKVAGKAYGWPAPRETEN